MLSRVHTLPALLSLVLLPFFTSMGYAQHLAAPDQRQLILEWPETLRLHDSSMIELTVTRAVDAAELYSSHNVMAVARLELAGVESDRYEIHEPLGPDKEINFRWKVRAKETGSYQGTVWLRLEITPKSGGTVDEVVVLASPVEIKVVRVFGLSAPLARILGAAGLFLSLFLAGPFAFRAARETRKPVHTQLESSRR